MGLAKWPLARDSPLIEQPGQGMDHRGFKRLGWAERWQEAGQARRQHGFSRSRRTDHQHVMPPGPGNFQGAFGPLLAFDVGKILGRLSGRHFAGLGWLKKVVPREMMQDCAKGGRGDDRGGLNPSRFGARGLRANQATALRCGGECRGQATGDLYQLAPQSQLPHEHAGSNLLLWYHAKRRQQGHRDGKVKM